jgi:hypothetical protein
MVKILSKYKYIAKDGSGTVFMYASKPQFCSDDTWMGYKWVRVDNIFDTSFLNNIPCEESLHRITDTGEFVKVLNLPDLPIDTKVYVRDYEHQEWFPRHFAGWDDQGQILVFMDGLTSFTDSFSDVVSWDYWKLAE